MNRRTVYSEAIILWTRAKHVSTPLPFAPLVHVLKIEPKIQYLTPKLPITDKVPSPYPTNTTKIRAFKHRNFLHIRSKQPRLSHMAVPNLLMVRKFQYNPEMSEQQGRILPDVFSKSDYGNSHEPGG